MKEERKKIIRAIERNKSLWQQNKISEFVTISKEKERRPPKSVAVATNEEARSNKDIVDLIDNM